MGLGGSKPWQLNLREILEKVRCYSACCGGSVVIEEHDESDHEDIDDDNPESIPDSDSDTETDDNDSDNDSNVSTGV